MSALSRRLGRIENATGLDRPGFCLVLLPKGASSDETNRAVARALGREPIEGDYILTIDGIETKDELRAKGLWP